MSEHDYLPAQTRFIVPRIPNAKIIRHALLARLDSGRDCALTLVAAAPGSGKSALLAQWARSLEGPVAWLSCDVDDADPAWFWRDVNAAIRHAWNGGAARRDGADRAAAAPPVGHRDGQRARPSAAGCDRASTTSISLRPVRRRWSRSSTHFRQRCELVLGSRQDPVVPTRPVARPGSPARAAPDRLAVQRRTRSSKSLADLGVELSPSNWLGSLSSPRAGPSACTSPACRCAPSPGRRRCCAGWSTPTGAWSTS